MLESRLICVDAGSITFGYEAASEVPPVVFLADRTAVLQPTPLTPGTVVTLSAGDAIAVPAKTRYELRNRGEFPPPVLLVVAFPPSSTTARFRRVPQCRPR